MTAHLLRLLLLTTLLCTPAISQVTPTGETRDRDSTSVGAAPSGFQRFSRGSWGTVAVTGINPSDVDSQEVISVYVGENAKRQFSKSFWLPANSKRKTWLPILVPEDVPLTENNVDMSVMRLNQSGQGESFESNEYKTPVTKRQLLLTDTEINTAIITDRVPPLGGNEVYRTVQEIQQTVDLGRDRVVDSLLGLGLIGYNANFLPPTPFALDELDQLIIASDRLLTDSAGVATVRAWLHRGGRVWILLDHTSDEMVDALLGDSRSYTRVDRVELNAFDLVASKSDFESQKTQSWESEKPVEMVRVITDSDDIAASVDGWPVAFWQPAGQGEVLMTTLGSRGWLQDQELSTAYYRICRRLFEDREEAETQSQAIAPILENQIGYEIPSRRLAAGVLAINALLILVAGLWWARQRRLERLALLIPVSATVAAVVLMTVGNRSTASVPSTVATGQIVRIDPALDEAHVSTVRAIYSQDSGELDLNSAYRTMTLPRMSSAAGSVQRIRWSDDGKSQWIGISQPPGVVRFADSESVISLPSSLVARGTFDQDGFRGTLVGLEDQPWQDGVIVAGPAPATAVVRPETEMASTAFRADAANMLAAGQFVSSALLSDDQRMRQDVLRELLSVPEKSPFGSQPSLLMWTQPFHLGVQFADRFSQTGTALVALPIEIERPAAGSQYRIPTTFLKIDSYAGNRGVSMVFNPRSGKWLQEMSKPADVELVCQFPRALLPMTVDRITVTMKVNAPSRILRVKSMIDGTPTVVFEQSDPTQLIQFDVDQAEALKLQDGGLWFSVSVSETKEQREALAKESDEKSRKEINEQEGQRPWQVDSLHIEALCTSPVSEPDTNDTNRGTGTK